MTVAAVPATLPFRVPWTTVGTAAAVAGLTTLLTATVPAWGDSTLTIRLVQLALAASAAYLLDDAAATLTTVAPQSMRRHRALPLVSGLVAVAISWTVVLLNLRMLPEATLRALTVEVAVLVLVTLAASAVLAMRGEPEPGNTVAVVVPLVGVGALLIGGMLGFDVFMGGLGSGMTGKAGAWAVMGGIAFALIVWATRDKPA